MGYIELKKIYYKNKDDYQKEYETRTNENYSIKYNFHIKGNQAFVCTTPEILSLICNIYQNSIQLKRVNDLLPKWTQNAIMADSLVEEIRLTNDIEGIYSTRKEIRDIIDNASEDKKRRFEGLVKKYILLLDINYHKPIFSCSDLRALYDDIVLDEITDEKLRPDGEIFRKDIAEVIASTQKVVHKGVFPESKIVEDITKALTILNSDTPSELINIAVFHYLLGYIHPFYDGNGRLNRFISSLYLAKALHPMVAYRIAQAIKENKSEYYKCFDICNDEKNRGDLTLFVTMFLKNINSALLKLVDIVWECADAIEFFANLLKNTTILDVNTSNITFVLIQKAVFSSEGISREQLSQITNLSNRTVKTVVENAQSKGIPIQSVRIGRKIGYKVDLRRIEEFFKENQNSN